MQPCVESIANALPHTRVGDRMPGKNRGKKRKTQYCLSYTRRGNQLWQPVCPFLRFLPYTYGEAFRQPFYGALGRISSLHVWGSPHAHDPSLTCHVVFPTCYGGAPASPGDARTGSWSSLHYGGVPSAVPFPMLLTPPFGRPEASPHAPRARQCCAPVWTGFHGGGSFPARFLLCSLQETAMRNSVGAAGCRFAKEYT